MDPPAAITRELDRLLGELFAPDELRLFLRRFVDRDLLQHLPSGPVKPVELTAETTRVLVMHGHVSRELFVSLLGVRPERAAEIRRLASAAGLALPAEVPRLYLRHVDGSTRVRRVFISYAHFDADWAQATELALGHADIEVVRDVVSFAGGEDIQQRIRRELDRVDRVILGWSRHARASSWVREEYAQALQIRREEGVDRFLAIELLDDTPVPDELAMIKARRSYFRTAVDHGAELSSLAKEDRAAVLRIIASLAARRGA